MREEREEKLVGPALACKLKAVPSGGAVSSWIRWLEDLLCWLLKFDMTPAVRACVQAGLSSLCASLPQSRGIARTTTFALHTIFKEEI